MKIGVPGVKWISSTENSSSGNLDSLATGGSKKKDEQNDFIPPISISYVLKQRT